MTALSIAGWKSSKMVSWRIFGDVANKRKKAILMQVYGEAVKKFVLSLDEDIKNYYPQVIKSISVKFTHHANETVERHIFNTMEQDEEESIEHFLMRLKL